MNNPEQVSASFGRAARTYAGHARVQQAMADWLAAWLPAERQGRALELGAGTGLFTRQVLPWHGEFVATDIAEEMCAQGRSFLPEVDWRRLPAENPAGGPWDWMLTSSMLQWVENPVAVLRAWCETLAPGGRVLAGFFADGSLPELRGLTRGWTPLTWRTPEEWADCVEQGGLRILRSESTRRFFHHDSALEMLRSVHKVGAAPERQFSAGRLRKILRTYDKLHTEAEGVRSTWVFHRFEAVRA